MWNKKKLLKIAEMIKGTFKFPYNEDIQNILESSDTEIGGMLIEHFVKVYNKDFMRDLWDGTDEDFEKSYTEIYAKLSSPTKNSDTTSYDSTIATLLHIKRVNSLVLQGCAELMKRAQHHDDSKLKDPEKPFFDSETPKLAGMTYGTPGYKESKRVLKPALDHHYAHNSHHPEHYKDGINDFDLFDLFEMFFDWKASSERHHDGNILKSIEENADRFGISPQLVRILNNTAKKIDKF